MATPPVVWISGFINNRNNPFPSITLQETGREELNQSRDSLLGTEHIELKKQKTHESESTLDPIQPAQCHTAQI